jgi:ribonuclease P protein component
MFSEGGRARGGALVVVVRENGLPETRLGLSVGKSIWKSAVRRNRVRRVFREAFRLHRRELPAGVDVVMIPAVPKLDPVPRRRLAASSSSSSRRRCGSSARGGPPPEAPPIDRDAALALLPALPLAAEAADVPFSPTCSQYAIEAIERHGIFRGSALAVWRILRCHPFCRGGPRSGSAVSGLPP